MTMMMMTAVAKLLMDRWMDEWFSGMRLVIITHTLQCGGPKTSETDGVQRSLMPHSYHGRVKESAQCYFKLLFSLLWHDGGPGYSLT